MTTSGKVTVKLSLAIELATGCHYELKSVTGNEKFGEFFGIDAPVVTTLQKGVTNPPSCVKTAGGKATVYAGALAYEQPYTVALT